MMKRTLLADAMLLFIAISWGYTFVLSKDLLEEMTPLFSVGTRFLAAAILMLPFLVKYLKQLTRVDLKQGLITGLALSLAYNFQIFGISMTTPGKAGIITGSAVVFVPLLYYLWVKKPVERGALLGTLFVFFGLISFSWTGRNDFSGLNFGDFLALCGAVFFAVHVIIVDHVHRKSESRLPQMMFIMLQLLVVGVSTLLLAVPLEPMPTMLSPYGWFAFSFDMLIGTLLAYIVQIYAQKHTHPANVSIILSFESFFAYLFSWLLWGEMLTLSIGIGIILFVFGILSAELSSLPALAKWKWKKPQEDG